MVRYTTAILQCSLVIPLVLLLLPACTQCFQVINVGNQKMQRRRPCIQLLRPQTYRFVPTPTQRMYMSSLIVDDSSNSDSPAVDTATMTSLLSSEQQMQAVLHIPPSQQQQQQEQQVLQPTSLTKRWMNTGLTIGTLVAITACLVTLDTTTPGIWDGTSITDMITQIPNEIWQQYSTILLEHPIMTKAITSATVYTIGDVIAQQQQQTTSTTGNELDRIRTLRSMIAGFIGHGPMSHFWYIFCDNFFIQTLHITAWWAFIPKVIIDQTIWGPIWNNTYLLLIGLMKMERLDVIWDDIKKSTVPMVVSGLKLWPAAHTVTYGLVPIENRLLWVDLVEIIWVTVLSKQAASLDKTTNNVLPLLDNTTTYDVIGDNKIQVVSLQQLEQS